MQYWAGCPQTPNSKWQQFVHVVQACAERGWRTYLVWSSMPEAPELSRPFLDCGCRILLQPRAQGNFDVRCVLQTYRLLRRYRCDIFHCHNVHTSPLIGATLAGVPVRIWSKLAMSPYYEQAREPTGLHRLQPSVRISCALAHRTLCISTAVRDELLAIGIPGGKLTVMLQPVDLARYQRSRPGAIRDALGLQPQDVVVTAVGHAVPVKGWDIAIRAVADVRQRLPTVHLLLVGSTNSPEESQFAPRLRQLVQTLSLEGAVHFLGRRADVAEILAASDIFLFPSRSEGQGLALTEAMAAGLPCVAARVGGIVDLIVDGENGFLCERDDADALARRLIELLQDEGLRRRFTERGRQSVQGLSMESITHQTVCLYREVLRMRTGV